MAELDKCLTQMELAGTKAEFDRLTQRALSYMHINVFKLRTTEESPVEVLIEALVKNKDLKRADSISQSYLRLVEKSDLADT